MTSISSSTRPKAHDEAEIDCLSQTLAMIGRDDILIAAHQVSKDDKELLFRYGILAAFDKNTDVSDVSLTMLRVLVSMAKKNRIPPRKCLIDLSPS
ncbi:MAG: hypothetical protein ACLUIQ_05775 [Dialister invisus]